MKNQYSYEERTEEKVRLHGSVWVVCCDGAVMQGWDCTQVKLPHCFCQMPQCWPNVRVLLAFSQSYKIGI